MNDPSSSTNFPKQSITSPIFSANRLNRHNLVYPEQSAQLVGQLESEKVPSFLERIKQAREERRRNKLKVSSTDLQEQIKKVTQSQSRILQQFEESRRSRLQSSDSNASPEYFGKRRSSGMSLVPRLSTDSHKGLSRIPSCSKINERQIILPEPVEHSPSKIPKTQMLKSLNCMVKAKARIRENISNYERPSEIIQHARKMEKMARCKEAELKAVPPLTSKAMQIENHINNSLIGSIKAKMSLLAGFKA